MKDAKARLITFLAELNNDAHARKIDSDSSGNTQAYRIATHDGANYLYFSDFYGLAMSSYEVDELSEEACESLLRRGVYYFPEVD